MQPPAAAAPPFSRRHFLYTAAAGALAACAPAKAVGYRGYALVANAGSRSVSVVDLLRFRLRRQIPLDSTPAEIIAHPAAPKAYVLNSDAGSVSEIDAVKFTVSRTVHVAGSLRAMQLAPAAPNPAVPVRTSSAGTTSFSSALWALSREPSELVEIPLDTLTPRRRVRLPWPADGFTLSSNHAAVAAYRERAIALVSLERGAIDRIIESKDEPSLLHFRVDGVQIIAASHPDRALTIFDVSSGRTIVRLPVGIAPRNFCPDNTGGQLYVSGEGMDAVVVIYPFETEVGQTILAGHLPDAMAVVPQGDSAILLVANPENDRVTALDANSTGKSLITVVDVGQDPRRIVITPDNSFALVLNRRSGDLSVIRQASLNVAKPFRRPTPVFTMIPVGEEPVSAAVIPWTA